MAASDYVSETPEFTLALKGASTDGKPTFMRYGQSMAEDPRYLRNESRSAYRLHRRNKRMLGWTVAIWLMVLVGFTGAAVLDVIANLGWGYEARDIWGGLLMIVGGCVFWAFATTVNHVVLAISRRLYGPEPTGPTEG